MAQAFLQRVGVEPLTENDWELDKMEKHKDRLTDKGTPV